MPGAPLVSPERRRSTIGALNALSPGANLGTGLAQLPHPCWAAAPSSARAGKVARDAAVQSAPHPAGPPRRTQAPQSLARSVQGRDPSNPPPYPRPGLCPPLPPLPPDARLLTGLPSGRRGMQGSGQQGQAAPGVREDGGARGFHASAGVRS